VTLIALGGLQAIISPPVDAAASPAISEDKYIDKTNQFAIAIPPGWTIIPKVFPTSTPIAKYQSEEVLLVASIFVESATLSVTRSYAPRLLKDFDIEWWFGTIASLADVGPADLIARLLILQRQGEFEKRLSPSEFVGAAMSSDGKAVDFDFLTPIAEGVQRRTRAKVLFRNGYLYVLWISGLDSVFIGDYGQKLREISDSFELI
jgi:hypothetical protein